ncbi:MAG: DUF3800 domain-containing protein [Gallionella sp.]|jgi:hypothetical protein
MVAVSTFYIDDSGTRHPDHKAKEALHGHDWFALGGILIDDDKILSSNAEIDAFRARWPQLADAPLHSSEIRGQHKNFAWLGLDTKVRKQFIDELGQLLLALPATGLACIIDRPGYNHRYMEKYGRERWSLCKTAFDVVVERAVKFSNARGRKLRVYVERCSKADDALLHGYYNSLKGSGHSFNPTTASIYNPLDSVDYDATLYEFRTKAKSSKLMQIADIYLWPMCIGGYDEGNRAYSALKDAGKLIDCLLPRELVAERGIKYSCFDLVKRIPKNAKAE